MDFVLDIISLVLISVFYSAYFYKQVLLKKVGINSNQLGKTKEGTKNYRLEEILKFFTYLTAIMQFLSFFKLNIFIQLSFPLAIKILGVAILIFGVSIFIIAMVQMKNNWRAGIDPSAKTNLVKDGVYKISRNPAFVGFYCLYIGTFFVVPNLVLLLIILLTIILFHLQILQEEKYLITVFGNEYEEYIKKVPRYIFI